MKEDNSLSTLDIKTGQIKPNRKNDSTDRLQNKYLVTKCRIEVIKFDLETLSRGFIKILNSWEELSYCTWAVQF